MINEPLTVNEVLRHVHHDFLNKLQLIKMNLDLDNKEGADDVLMNLANCSKNFFVMNDLHAERLVEWLHTCEWRFPELNITMENDITDSLPKQWDEPLRNYLEETLQHVAKSVDPLVEQKCLIKIISNVTQLVVSIEITGRWSEAKCFATIDAQGLVVEQKSYSSFLWRFSVLGSKEGIY